MSLPGTTKHRRELLVNPLFWTACHLDSFACSFRHVPTKAHRLANEIQESADINEKTNDAEILSRSAVPNVKRSILSSFLLEEESVFNQRSKAPKFYFAGQSVHRPYFNLFLHRTQAGQISQDGPFLGYLDYLDVTSKRVTKLSPSGVPIQSQNPIGARLFAKKMARITPQEWTEDPYFICVLLSIAQFQRRLSKDSSRRAFSTCLLVVNREDHEFVHIYEAQITNEFLDMLDKSAIATTSINGPAVYHRKIPYRPFENFPERIRAETLASATADEVDAEKKAVKRPLESEDDQGRNVMQKH
ncbi:hypothetical protein BDW42DRAFT_92987 [Aspergillus taichungensis]|uniref:Uncharacterized protein n=1 Tax=Aspergillus taichungensis TaxID=482145 RepID=A0A2J5I8G1_9EURO|nr:hypothetical protein BDW42DRAFT_92987 [Aspergillus taichungensis]